MLKYKQGNIIKVTVNGIENYGIFVSCDNYYTGLIHISEISTKFVSNINNFVKIGDIIKAKVLDVDEERGHLKLSIKNINYKNTKQLKKKRIKETSLGFSTLAYHLPFWIEYGLKKIKNKSNSIDKL